MVDSPQGAPIDRYQVLEYLAEGGMGAIYLGKKLGAGGFEKKVVLKQLLPEFVRQPEFIDLFLREARLSATLDHANIIHTIDLVTAGEEHFIVMEYLDGADLRSLLKRAKRRHRQLSAAAGIYVARELLSALAYAHNKVGSDGKHLRLIHRDISPSNILVSGNGEVKLTDFGIAKAATHNSVFYRVKGKVGYMSPEQARSESLDARSDLYSLAVCLYEMITGERLFVAAGLTTSAEKMYSQPVPRVSDKVTGLPADLDVVMFKALAIDPNRRYQTAGEFQEALLRCAHRNGLMMSAPELAEHLGMVCGPPDSWRDGQSRTQDSPGTEIYESVDDSTAHLANVQDSAYEADYELLAFGDRLFSGRGQRRDRAPTSLTHLGHLKGMELTSLVNLGGGNQEGARPLVDLSLFYRRDDPSEPKAGRMQRPAPAAATEQPTRSPRSTASRHVPEERSQAEPSLTGVVVSGPDTAHAAGREEALDARAGRPRHLPRPWLVISLILLVGVLVAAIIGFTGPSLDLNGVGQSPAGASGHGPQGGRPQTGKASGE